MKFEALKNRSIMLFGKSRALAASEFSRLLKQHDITLSDVVTDDLEVIVEGRLINPIEQERLDTLYVQKRAPIIELEPLERWLCSTIDADNLLMSLKLSGDRDRLMGYLQNIYIDNSLFLRLLKLYDWQGEGFFENDENRDITAALISRFYENIERNHNVQYANMGIMHLLNQSQEGGLVETIALLAPLQMALREGCDNSTKKILHAIALHPKSSVKVLKLWTKNGDDDIQMLIAMRHDLSLQLQEYLLNLKKPVIDEVLSLNPTIAHTTALLLMERFAENIARHITLDEMLFTSLREGHAEAVAANASLSLSMQQQLLKGPLEVCLSLAKNPAIDDVVFEELLHSGSKEVVKGLLSNPKVTSEQIEALYAQEKRAYAREIAASEKSSTAILEELSQEGDIEVLLALAKNSATPVALLYQFQLDSRLARAVKENASFGRHIQRDNIGWDV